MSEEVPVRWVAMLHYDQIARGLRVVSESDLCWNGSCCPEYHPVRIFLEAAIGRQLPDNYLMED